MSKEFSILFYIFSFAISSFIFRISYKVKLKKTFKWIAILIPLLIASFRKDVGTDYTLYINGYYLPMKTVSIFESWSKEYGFLILAKIATIFNSPKIMFFLSSFLTIVFIKKSIEESDIEEKYLSYLVYLYVFFLESLNIGRQHISVAIFLFSIKYIFQKKFFYYIISIFFASLFHKTVLITLPLYFIYNSFLVKIKNKRVKDIIILIFSLLVLSFIINYQMLTKYIIKILPNFVQYKGYLKTFNGTRNLIIYLKIFFLLIIFSFKKRLVKLNKKNELYIFCIILDLIITYIGFYQVSLKRISLYFYIIYIFLFPQLIEIKKQNKLTVILIIIFSVFLCIMNFYIFEYAQVIPYKI